MILEFKVLPGTGKEDIARFVERHLKDGVEYEIVSFEKGFESNFANSALQQQIEWLTAICREEGFDARFFPCWRWGAPMDAFSDRKAAWCTAVLLS